jgi:hypothetical protein
MKYGWVNRNRVLSPAGGWQYILAPLKKHAVATPINQVEIVDDRDWTGLILRQLLHYKKDAPYYREVTTFLESCFAELDHNLSRVNTRLFRGIASRLGIERPIQVYSEMDLPLRGPVHSPGDWGMRIAEAAGATEFINRPGGAAFLDESDFRRHGIKLTIQTYKSMVYGCGTRPFEPDLSIVDVMMWNSPEKIKHYLDTWRTPG